MAYQVALASYDQDYRTVDAGLAFGGNLYETFALAEYMRAKRYGRDDGWSIVVDLTPAPAEVAGPVQPVSDTDWDDIPF